MRGNLIPVIELMDQHLMAEWRELKMVPAALRKSLRTRTQEQILDSIPSKFVLGKGHITFWYNKLTFLTERYATLTVELLGRGYNLKYRGGFETFTKGLPNLFFNNYFPTPGEIETSRKRIEEKIAMKPTWYKKSPSTL
jgi:deoxyribonuclease (pyrimidine dimer)